MFHRFVPLKRLTCAAGCSRAAEAFLATSCYDPFLWQQCVFNESPKKVKEVIRGRWVHLVVIVIILIIPLTIKILKCTANVSCKRMVETYQGDELKVSCSFVWVFNDFASRDWNWADMPGNEVENGKRRKQHNDHHDGDSTNNFPFWWADLDWKQSSMQKVTSKSHKEAIAVALWIVMWTVVCCKFNMSFDVIRKASNHIRTLTRISRSDGRRSVDIDASALLPGGRYRLCIDMDGPGNSEVAHHETLQESSKSLACFFLSLNVVISVIQM